MDKIKLGKMVRKLRIKCGLTQADLAKKLNVSDKAVSKWESGGGYPDITQLPVLSEIFGVSIDYLLKGNLRGITIAGNVIVDEINTIDEYPEKSMLSHILATERAVGGCVPNTIIDLAKIDSSLHLEAVGKVGNDENGRFVVSEMKKHGIDVSRVEVEEDNVTAVTHVMFDQGSKERTFFYNKGANGTFCIEDISIDTLDCEFFHIGYAFLLDALDAEDEEYGTKLARLLYEVNKRGIKTSIDAISSDRAGYAEKIIPVLKYCNYTIMNEVECSLVTGISPKNPDGTISVENIKRTLEKFMEYGVQEKAIIHCKEAGFMMNASGEFICVPSLNVPKEYIKGNVGAGDAFAAGCLYGLYEGYDDKRVLEFASCAAVANLSAPDAISGMKNKKELEKLETLFERKEIL